MSKDLDPSFAKEATSNKENTNFENSDNRPDNNDFSPQKDDQLKSSSQQNLSDSQEEESFSIKLDDENKENKLENFLSGSSYDKGEETPFGKFLGEIGDKVKGDKEIVSITIKIKYSAIDKVTGEGGVVPATKTTKYDNDEEVEEDITVEMSAEEAKGIIAGRPRSLSDRLGSLFGNNNNSEELDGEELDGEEMDSEENENDLEDVINKLKGHVKGGGKVGENEKISSEAPSMQNEQLNLTQ